MVKTFKLHFAGVKGKHKVRGHRVSHKKYEREIRRDRKRRERIRRMHRRRDKKRRHKRYYKKYRKTWHISRMLLTKKGRKNLKRLRHIHIGMKHLRHGRVRFYVSLNKKVLGAQNTANKPMPKKTALPKANLSGIKSAQTQNENQLQ